MFTLIENFYTPSDLGLIVTQFINSPFDKTHQSKETLVNNRMQAYPCYESQVFIRNENPHNPYNIFKNTFESKTNLKILHLKTFFRKIKLEELKQSACYRQDRPHLDSLEQDYAGLIYFNSNSIIDGTKIYNNAEDFEPTVIIGSKINRCVFYNSQQPHVAPTDQHVEERWVQVFFLITEEKTFNRFRGKEIKGEIN
jgi:hypothetical protein